MLSLLEALASAMPGIGFLLGGAIAAIFEPRLSYAVAGAGVLVVLVVAVAVAPRSVDWTPELEQGSCKTSCRTMQVPLQQADPSRTMLTGP